MAIALAAKKGKLKKKDLKGASKEMYESMNTSQLRDFAKTDTQDLPQYKEASCSIKNPQLNCLLLSKEAALKELGDFLKH